MAKFPGSRWSQIDFSHWVTYQNQIFIKAFRMKSAFHRSFLQWSMYTHTHITHTWLHIHIMYMYIVHLHAYMYIHVVVTGIHGSDRSVWVLYGPLQVSIQLCPTTGFGHPGVKACTCTRTCMLIFILCIHVHVCGWLATCIYIHVYTCIRILYIVCNNELSYKICMYM